MIDVLTASNVMERGLSLIGITQAEQQRLSHERLVDEFRAHYGCLPIDNSQQWYDMQTTEIDAACIPIKERTHKGFKMFMAANFFLWSHPKNAQILASRFKISIRRIQSNRFFWKWISRMGDLVGNKVVWDKE